MSDPRCKCSIAISMVGDGCRYCQPQEYIDRLSEWLDEEREEFNHLQADNEALRARLAELEAVVSGVKRIAEAEPKDTAILQLVEARIPAGAWLLRKQAEAVEAMCSEWQDEARWIINEGHKRWQRFYAKKGLEHAQSLRNAAEQIERGE